MTAENSVCADAGVVSEIPTTLLEKVNTRVQDIRPSMRTTIPGGGQDIPPQKTIRSSCFSCLARWLSTTGTPASSVGGWGQEGCGSQRVFPVTQRTGV